MYADWSAVGNRLASLGSETLSSFQEIDARYKWCAAGFAAGCIVTSLCYNYKNILFNKLSRVSDKKFTYVVHNTKGIPNIITEIKNNLSLSCVEYKEHNAMLQ